MVINGTSIKELGCEFWCYRITPAQYTGRSFWSSGVDSPSFIKGEYGWSNLEVDILVIGDSADEVELKKSRLNSVMVVNPVIMLDEIDKGIEYFCAYENQAVVDKINEIASLVTYHFKTVKRGRLKVIKLPSSVSEFDLLIDTQIPAPCIYEIISTQNIKNFVLDNIMVKQLEAGSVMIIDGISKTVKTDGMNDFGNVEMWEFPKLQPGMNKITINNTNVDVVVKYHPRYA